MLMAITPQFMELPSFQVLQLRLQIFVQVPDWFWQR
jgi:hypothetical protein